MDNSLRKAAEMALGVLLDSKTRADEVAEAVKVIRQALDDKPPVKTYCGGVPNYCTHEETRDNSSWVGLTHDEVNSWELPDSPTVFEFAQFIEAKLREKNGG